MQLNTIDGKLTLRSVYKLFFWGTLLSTSVLMGAGLLILVVVMLTTGETRVNGETVLAGQFLMIIVPVVLIVMPIMSVAQAFLAGALFTFGVWLYRLRRPLIVIPENQVTSA
jgi:hypothetical protein